MVLSHVNSQVAHRVTSVAPVASSALVNIDVTVGALRRRARVSIHDMAFGAVQLCVLALERKACLFLVIELSQRRPTRGRVAFVTRLGKLSLVKVLMTVTACRVDRLVVPLCVTPRTGDLLMLTLELKPADAMVKERNPPALETSMTFFT